MQQTLEQQLQARDNDYTALEEKYRAATGSELVRDPYASRRCTLGNGTASSHFRFARFYV